MTIRTVGESLKNPRGPDPEGQIPHDKVAKIAELIKRRESSMRVQDIQYDSEFKRNAVLLSQEVGRTVPEFAEHLGEDVTPLH